jgi:hypothetical protein
MLKLKPIVPLCQPLTRVLDDGGVGRHDNLADAANVIFKSCKNTQTIELH